MLTWLVDGAVFVSAGEDDRFPKVWYRRETEEESRNVEVR